VRASSLIGKIGVVTARVRGGALPGEVRVVVQGIPHHYLAYSPEPVEVDTQVLVVNNRGLRQVDVEPWQQAGPVGGIPL
jgi:hypothetical protein